MANDALWRELWSRATVEEIGIKFTTNSPDQAVYMLNKLRPPECKEYIIARTPDPNLIYLLKPSATIEQGRLPK
jgi:hypothetical protein